MVEVTIYKNQNGIYNGFKSYGHAGYAESGYDIICAGVSVLVINTINSIEILTEDKIDILEDEGKGLIELKLLSDVSEKTILLINSMILGLQGIRNDNGTEYISIVFKEV